jgi:hypothetical protein
MFRPEHEARYGIRNSGARSHLEFRIVDTEKPYISETGYFSHFGFAVDGCTVEQYACEIFREKLKKRVMLSPAYRCYVVLPSWLENHEADVMICEEESGQFSFGF